MRRNQIVDIIRGTAMLLVVLGHTLSGCTTAFQDSFLFQVIWTLQMPLFIIISGYVSKYSKPIQNVNELWKYIKKRTLAYLMPWAVWTILIRGLIFQQTEYLDIKYLLWHMDSGYWFLMTIWTISMIFGLADYGSTKLKVSSKITSLGCHLALCGVGMVLLAGIGYIVGMSFLCIKLTLYYTPIYLLGYIYGQIQGDLYSKSYSDSLINWSVAVALALWLSLIVRFNFYSEADGVYMIVLRFTTSIFGCVALIGLFTSIYENLKGGGSGMGQSTFAGGLSSTLPVSQSCTCDPHTGVGNNERSNNAIRQLLNKNCADMHEHLPNAEKHSVELSFVRQKNYSILLNWIGVHSLEIYLIHGLSLCILRFSYAPELISVRGWFLILANFIITVTLSCLYIRLIESNKLLYKIIFWK
ncbi:acyltransferase family protein [uncultured Bacteroides sp.]|uniref:acyltransferase family protein n=1 Tax=uncultured Bacteroides sp. TaxID=162156 RepID=UPI002AAB438E|nr:acyltransferase family protein [uncultured Bacteroides sp.]